MICQHDDCLNCSLPRCKYDLTLQERRNEDNKRWRETHSERVKENYRKWYAKNAERHKQKARENYRKNLPRSRAVRSKYYLENRDEILLKAKERYHAKKVNNG